MGFKSQIFIYFFFSFQSIMINRIRVRVVVLLSIYVCLNSFTNTILYINTYICICKCMHKCKSNQSVSQTTNNTFMFVNLWPNLMTVGHWNARNINNNQSWPYANQYLFVVFIFPTFSFVLFFLKNLKFVRIPYNNFAH